MAEVISGKSSLSSDSSEFWLNSDEDSSNPSSSEPARSSTKIDSDVPLAIYAKRKRRSPVTTSSSANGTSFQWKDEDSSPLKYGFTSNGGAVNLCIHHSSTCSETFDVFFY